MLRKFMFLTTAIAAILFSAPLHAQTAAPSAEDEARNLLKAMNVETQYKQMQAMMTQQIKPALQGISSSLPEEKRAPFMASAEKKLSSVAAGDPKELVEESVKVYARHYSVDELKGLAQFYASPLGKKLLAETPAITSEMMSATVRWNQSVANSLLGDLVKEFPELTSLMGGGPAPAGGEHHHE
jgi:hypothetical protein